MTERLTESTPLAGDHAVLARRYVGSLYALADKDGHIDDVSGDMEALRRLWEQSEELRAIATDPRLKNEAIDQVINQIAKMSGLHKLTSNFLSVVAQNRRLGLLPAFIHGFLDEVALRRGERRVDVRSAAPLSQAQQDDLLASLKNMIDGKIQLSVVEDAAIIGGFIVKYGSHYIDASVRTKLDRLERNLKANVAA